ncbi:hypothetical protein B9Z55_009218 [Caenorhabditis nigoni]|uniref:Uncharacterized protein n=1 Tax=Caenorhabditis nigoni TaxID=1611254 RepID=A0A2G5UR26_9PELO|nr:hypothetical protein B9Z55_009218 [Caenorhabditis nigoni]
MDTLMLDPTADQRTNPTSDATPHSYSNLLIVVMDVQPYLLSTEPISINGTPLGGSEDGQLQLLMSRRPKSDSSLN